MPSELLHKNGCQIALKVLEASPNGPVCTLLHKYGCQIALEVLEASPDVCTLYNGLSQPIRVYFTCALLLCTLGHRVIGHRVISNVHRDILTQPLNTCIATTRHCRRQAFSEIPQ